MKRNIPIARLDVGNFGCLREASVDFEPLTVLVGPNDSGKSMLLRALEYISRASRLVNGWQGVFGDIALLGAHTFNGKGGSVHFGVGGCIGSETFEYGVDIGAGSNLIGVREEHLLFGSGDVSRTEKGYTYRASRNAIELGPYVSDAANIPLLHPYWLIQAPGRTDDFHAFMASFEPLVDSIRNMKCYSLRPESLRRASGPSVSLSRNGLGLAHAIADLLLRGREVMERIEKALAEAMPQVKRVDITTQEHEGRLLYAIELVTRSGARIPTHFVSDGVLLFLGYLYLVLGPEPTSVLMVEEPETGVHPGLLRKLMQLFRDMTTGAHGGPPTQVILTTHSPMLLNLVEPEEIRVVQRGDDGATTITPFTNAPDLEKLLDYQGPGEIWVNQGEDYIVRGKGAP